MPPKSLKYKTQQDLVQLLDAAPSDQDFSELNETEDKNENAST